MTENEDDVCRFCLSNKGLMFPIFRSHASKNESSLQFKIMSCTSIEVFADDNLPKKICYVCTHQIEKFYQFQTMCLDSEKKLRGKLSQTTEEKTNFSGSNKQSEFAGTNGPYQNEKSKHVCQQTSDSLTDMKNGLDVSACFVCLTTFTSYNLLIDHLREAHINLGTFICNNCKISFSTASQFGNHMKGEHCLSCEHCDYVFKYRRNLQDHKKCHHSKVFLCKYCKKMCEDPVNVRKHEFDHLENTCSKCLKVLNSTENYRRHTEECKQKQYCMFCEQEFNSRKDLIVHVNNFHDSSHLRCANCRKTFTKFKEMEEHVCDNSSFECQTCQVHFNNELLLTAHRDTHHRSNVLTCKFCNKKFNLKSSLRRHEKSHSGIKPYQCKYCPRKFKDSSTCTVHMRTHTGEHPFQCQECHKDFKQLANLKMHTYRHHKKNEKLTWEEDSSVMNQDCDNFQDFYNEEIIESRYSDINCKDFQTVPLNIPGTYNSNLSIIISDQK